MIPHGSGVFLSVPSFSPPAAEAAPFPWECEVPEETGAGLNVGMRGMGWSYLLLVLNGIWGSQNLGIWEPNPTGGGQENS